MNLAEPWVPFAFLAAFLTVARLVTRGAEMFAQKKLKAELIRSRARYLPRNREDPPRGRAAVEPASDEMRAIIHAAVERLLEAEHTQDLQENRAVKRAIETNWERLVGLMTQLQTEDPSQSRAARIEVISVAIERAAAALRESAAEE